MKCILAMAAVSMALAAQDGPPPGGRPGPGRGPGIGFRALDTDQDGVISAKEIAGAAASLNKLDKNGDGQITEDEVRPVRREGGGPEREGAGPNPDDLVQQLMAFDKNKDGKLSKAELPERMQGMFDRADSNHDGFLTADEIRAMAASQAPQGPGPGGRPPERLGDAGRRPGGPGGMMRFDPIFAAIDTDHDGILSSAEIRNAPAALKVLDKNQDGQITQDEARPAFGPRGGRGEGREPLD